MEEKSSHFIRQIIEADLQLGKNDGRVHTRFPPEPNGYLHMGHTKSICLNFAMAHEFAGQCNLRFDDTNPEKEEQEYIEAIKRDITWLGFKWDKECYASDYFETLYGFAVKLIEEGKAFVCDLDGEQMREYRGTLTEAGKESPFRKRSVAENLDLFSRMKAGEFKDGEKTLRAKIDMAHSNMNMRDPVMYRIKHVEHPRTGNTWCIYPSYDFAHGQSDSIEKITHSICTLEFEDHQPIYRWYIENLDIFPSCQYEFARLNINYLVMSKRKLLRLVNEGYVSGWDDPRMPSISGMRRRGIPAEALRNLCETVGVTKYHSVTDIALLEFEIRNVLNRSAQRRMVVQDPLRVVITNMDEGAVEMMEAVNNPEDPEAGTREVPFSRELYIEGSDFLENAPKKFFRLKPGGEVRLRYAYVLKCDEVIKDEQGKPTELRCSIDKNTLGKNPEDRKVKGVIHWVSVKHAMRLNVRLYDRLFTVENPDSDGDKDFVDFINPESLTTIQAYAEPAIATAKAEQAIQFERLGYYCLDNKDSMENAMVFNRTIALRDSWAKKK